MLSLIDAKQAIEQFSINKRAETYRGLRENNQKVRFLLWDGDLTLPGGLHWDLGVWNEKGVLLEITRDFDADKLAEAHGLIVNGDLRVEGAIINTCRNTGPLLVVTGNVQARHLVGGGAEIRVEGDANIEEVVWGEYNDGILSILGDVKAPVVLNRDHYFEIYGKTNSEWVGGFDDSDEEAEPLWDDFLPASLRQLVKEGVALWDDFEQVVYRGDSVLARNNAQGYEQWFALVAQDGQRLLSVPTALVDRVLCEVAVKSDSRAIVHVPKKLLDRDLCWLAAGKECAFAHIPLEYWDDGLLQHFLRHNGAQIEAVVSGLGEERLTPELAAAAVAGGANFRLPERFRTDEVAILALDHGREVLDTMFSVMVSQAVYHVAKSRYGDDPDWAELEARHRLPKEITTKNFASIWGAFITEKAWLALIALDPRVPVLRFVPETQRTKTLALAAVKQSAENIQWCPKAFLTKELCLWAVKESGNVLTYVPAEFRDEKFLTAMVTEWGGFLQEIPEEERTVPVCVAALLNDSDAYTYVPQERQLEVCSRLIDHYAEADPEEVKGWELGNWLVKRARRFFELGSYQEALQDVERALERCHADEEAYYCRALVYRAMGEMEKAEFDAVALLACNEDFVEDWMDEEEGSREIANLRWLAEAAAKAKKNKSEKKWEKAVERCPILLSGMPENMVTADLVNRVMAKFPGAVADVPRRLMTPELYRLGLEKECLDFKDIPKDCLSEELCLVFVKQSGYGLCQVPMDLRTEAVCRAAVENVARAWDYVPEGVREKLKK